MAGDPFWSSVVALLANDSAANGTTTLADQSPENNSYNRVGNPAYTTSNPPTGLSSSVSFDGAGNDTFYTPDNADFALPGDYTVEFFIRVNGTSQVSMVCDFRPNLNNNLVIWLTGTAMAVYYNSAIKITGALPTNLTWAHYAACRSGSSVKFFLDGTQTGSTATDSTSFPSAPFFIGNNFSTVDELNGQIASIRVTKAARYTTTFTPPTLPLPTGPAGGPFPYYIRSAMRGGIYLPKGF